MIPQIFISSTFYDLKYAREDLENFIKGYGFEAILFENGDVGYAPGEELDVSCYRTMNQSDMSILIVGGRYGSPASEDVKEDLAYKEYLSVTRKEFDTAIKANIPVFAFVEENVLNEYHLYSKNREKFENGHLEEIEFYAVDNINVFRFIDSIYTVRSIPVFEFKRIQAIKDILKKQWADMFKTYLVERKSRAQVKEIEPSINQIYSTIQSMEVMLQSVGKQVIGENTSQLESVFNLQYIENIAGKIASSFEFVTMECDKDKIKEYLVFFVDKLCEAKQEGLLQYPFSDNIDDITKFYSMFEYENTIISQVKMDLQFDENVILGEDGVKKQLVNRLMQEDYLKRMKFIN